MDFYLKLGRQFNRISVPIATFVSEAKPFVVIGSFLFFSAYLGKVFYKECQEDFEKMKIDDQLELEKRNYLREKRMQPKPVVKYVEQ